MNIQIPNQMSHFEEGLKNAIEMIKSYRTGISFLSSLVDLLETLRKNSITEKWISQMDTEGSLRKEKFNAIALDIFEHEWLFLWELHLDRKSKRHLIKIKQLVTTRIEWSSQTPIIYICSLFSEFRRYSPIAKKIQNIRAIYLKTEKRYSYKKDLIKAKHQKEEQFFDFKKMLLGLSCNRVLIGRVVIFDQNLCSPKFHQFFREYPELCMSGESKRYYIQTATELDTVYLWDRLCLLEKIWLSTGREEQKRALLGKWGIVRDSVMQRFTEISCRYIFYIARNKLIYIFRGDGFQPQVRESLPFLAQEFYFSRKECEAYLDQLQRKIKGFILGQQANMHFLEEPFIMKHSLTKKEKKIKAVVEHGVDYWKKHRNAKHNEVYADYADQYKDDCYKHETWVKIIRENNVDPRKANEKTRGKSIKGR